jgi:hypothetical protein
VQARTQNQALATTRSKAMTHTEAAADSRNAALAARLAAACGDPRHHCALVLAANAAVVACGASEPCTPALVLHLLLLPFNTWRLARALGARRPARPMPVAPSRAREAAGSPQAATMRHPEFDARNFITTVRLSPRAVRR